MSKVLIEESSLSGIGNAIRSKLNNDTVYKPSEMASAIESITTGSVSTLVSKTVTVNGTYDPASDSADGYNEVIVNVPNSYSVSDGGKVVSNGALVAQTARSSEITENGTYDTTTNNSVTVNVSAQTLPSAGGVSF